MKRKCIAKSVFTMAACISMVIPAMPVSAADYEFRTGDDGKLYWYEFGVKQGTVNDTQGILGDGTNRGREIYDSATNGWYWLDSVYDGAKACGKEVWIPYIYQDELIMSADGNGRMANGISDEAKIKELAQASITSEADMSAQVEEAIRNRTGKWVRYDENGVMLKGWVKIEGALAICYPNQAGNIYYYDQKTGLMAKGNVTINGVQYHFDEISGILDSGDTPQQEYVCTSYKTYKNDVLDSETFCDERGNEIKIIKYKSDGSSYIYGEYQYDEKGNNTYRKSDNYEFYYEYDSEGNRIKTNYFIDGKLEYIYYVREQDEHGNAVKEEDYKSNGELQSINTYSYEYSETGYKMKEIIDYQNSDESIVVEGWYTKYKEGYNITHTLFDSTYIYILIDYQYDDSGNVISQISYNRDGSIQYTTNTVFEYDSHGNLATATTTKKDSTGAVTEVSVNVYQYSLVNV